ncbi:MAG: tyrosine-type recombinase/integrase [Chthoniobacter sp.]
MLKITSESGDSTTVSAVEDTSLSSGKPATAPKKSAAKHHGGTWAKLVNVASNLYRNPDSGIYYGRRKIDGRPQLHCLETADRKTADNKLAEWLGDARRVNPVVSRSTLDELLGRFEASRVHCEDATKVAEEGFTKSFRAFFDCQRRAGSVRGSELKTFVNQLASTREYSANTYNRLCLFVRQLFELAKSDGMTAENLYALSGLKYKTVHRPPPAIPTLEQFEKILAEVRAQKKNRKGMASADLLEFEGRAGLGQAEAGELRWTDIDLKGGSMGEMRIQRVKTGKYFTVPLYPKLRPLLERMRTEAEQRALKDGQDFDPKNRVFIIDNARKALTNACARLKFPDFSQRNLRQMFILEAYRAGVDVKTIAKWQGHQDGGKLIMDTYTEVFGADQQDFEKKQLAKLA